MIRSIDDKVNHYRKPIMKEKSSVQNDLIAESRDKRMRDREKYLENRRSHSVAHNVDSVVFRSSPIDESLLSGGRGKESITTWGGMTIVGDPETRFRRNKDHIRNW